jgi:hypothetical protein
MRFLWEPFRFFRSNFHGCSRVVFSFVKSQAGYPIRTKGEIRQKADREIYMYASGLFFGHSIVFRQAESVVFGSEQGTSFQLFYRIFCFSKIGPFHIFGFPAACQKCAERYCKTGIGSI